MRQVCGRCGVHVGLQAGRGLPRRHAQVGACTCTCTGKVHVQTGVAGRQAHAWIDGALGALALPALVRAAVAPPGAVLRESASK